MPIFQVAVCGDSTVEGDISDVKRIYGGQGCWADLLADAFSPWYGPVLGPGYLGVRGIGSFWDEWTGAGSWTWVGPTDVHDKAPGRAAFSSSGGSGATRTWTKPAGITNPIVGFHIYWIDYAAGGDWQYRIDGGTWTNMGQTRLGDNALKKFYIASAITSTFDVRAYDGASAAGCCYAGLEPFYIAPQGLTAGVVVHNLGINGIRLVDNFCRTGSGDWGAWFDTVTLGSGSPITNSPDLVIAGPFTNDVLDGLPATNYQTAYETLWDRVSSKKRLLLNAFEQDPASRASATQSGYRTAASTAATNKSVAELNVYDRWGICATPVGYDGIKSTSAAAFLVDQFHQSQVGHLDLGRRVVQEAYKVVGFGPLADPFTLGSSLLGASGALLGGLIHQTVTLSGRVSTATVGSLTPRNYVTLTGRASTLTVGTPTLTPPPQTVTLAGRATTLAIGVSAAVPGTVTKQITGRASTLTIGTPIVGEQPLPDLAYSKIEAKWEWGRPTVKWKTHRIEEKWRMDRVGV